MQNRLFSDMPGRVSQIVQEQSDDILAFDLVIDIPECSVSHESHFYVLTS